MKLLEALRNVDRSDPVFPDVEEIASDLDLNVWYSDLPSDHEERLKAYWLIKWNCTDTWVGVKAIYFDGTLVGMSKQDARKSSIEFRWMSRAAAADLATYLRPETKVTDVIHEEDEVEDFYSLGYVSQLLHDEGSIVSAETGERIPVTVERDELRRRNAWGYKFDGDGQDINVKLPDGSLKQIHISDLHLAISVKKEQAE